MTGLEWTNRGRRGVPAPRFLGLAASGRLSLEDLEREALTMQPGGIYELMCHPGHLDAQEVSEGRLLAYHAWEGELSALTSPLARSMLESRGVRLIGYRHLEVRDGQLAVRPEVRYGS
jgi:hypothetical protein